MVPVKRNGPAQGFAVILFEGEFEEIVLAVWWMDILVPDIDEFLGPGACIEENGDWEMLLGCGWQKLRHGPKSLILLELPSC
jgi:hypothetical protein